jgi:hypothetical protein
MKIPYKQAIRAMTMTANEMADRNEWACCAYSKEVSAMLRQQQAEIESLKDKIISYENLGSMMINELLQKASEK